MTLNINANIHRGQWRPNAMQLGRVLIIVEFYAAYRQFFKKRSDFFNSQKNI